jgi:AraC-like DNA-binding protein
MLKFYRNAVIASLGLIIASVFICYIGITKSQLTASLFPARDEELFWKSAIEPTQPKGKTQLNLKNELGNIEYDFFLDPDRQFPYVHYSIYFANAIQSTRQVDLTRYSSVSFKIICDPKNVLQFVLFSFDDKVTDLNNLVTRRVSSIAFSCQQEWKTITFELEDLNTSQWWLNKYGFDYSETGYRLDKTMGFAWVNSLQSPLNTSSSVKITEVKLHGSEPRYLYVAGALCIGAWILFFVWQFRRYLSLLTMELKARVKQDQPLIAYKKLSLGPQKDKEKDAVLRYMATEYTDPNLSLESAMASLGINRNKINDLLKEELGLTFIAYLNKLRLTEAARRLSEKSDINVSEIAYSVGYNNVPYFNKLFKQEYGCTPKTFKAIYQSDNTV